MHYADPFEEVLRVPLIISFPRLLKDHGGRVVDGYAWSLDLMPTILGLAQAEKPRGLEGMDLTPVMLGAEGVPGDRAVFPAVRGRGKERHLRRVVIHRGMKQFTGHPDFGEAEGYLFDLEDDPREQTNLWRSRPEVRAALDERRRRYVDTLDVEVPAGEGSPGPTTSGLSEAEIRELRALGYVE